MGTYTVIRIFLPQGIVTVSNFLPETVYVYSNVCIWVSPCLSMSAFSPGPLFFTQRYSTLFFATAHLIIWKLPTSSTLIVHLLIAQFYSSAFTNSAAVNILFIYFYTDVSMCLCNTFLEMEFWDQKMFALSTYRYCQISPHRAPPILYHIFLSIMYWGGISCLPRTVPLHSVVRLFDVCPHKRWKMYVTIVTFLSFTRF